MADNNFSLEDYGINTATNLELQDALADFIVKRYEEAVQHRRNIGVDGLLLRNLRANKCEYQPEEKELIGPYNDVYIGIAALKARSAESWLTDIILNNIDKPWTLDPTPKPDLPESQVEQTIDLLIQELPSIQTVEALRDRAKQLKAAQSAIAYAKAEKATARMETIIEDQLFEGGWTQEFAKLVSDVCAYPNCFLRGPVVIGKRMGVWDGDKYEAKIQQIPTVRTISPFDAFPSPNATGTQDGDYFIERARFGSGQLYGLIGVEGFHTANIRACLARHPSGYKKDFFTDVERKALEEKGNDLVVHTEAYGEYETVVYNGIVPGSLLADHGIIVPDRQNSYECEVWMVDDFVIRAMLNPNPTGQRPIFTSSYRKVTGQFWGQGVICLVYDTMRVCNAAARNLIRNMGYASGPIGEVVGERVAETQDPTDVTPYKIFLVGPDLTGTGAPAYRFHNINSIAADLMAVVDRYMKLADDISGVPSYVLGNPQVAGAGRTLGGLSMLMGNAAKGIKSVQLNIDRDIISGVVTAFYVYNMLTNDDDSIKADCRARARGATGLLQRELAQTRTVELLQLLTPYIEKWDQLPDGIKVMLREVLKTTGLPVDKIIPDPNQGEDAQDLQHLFSQGSMPGEPGQGQASGVATAMNRGLSGAPALPPQSMPSGAAAMASIPTPVNMPQGA